MGYAGVFFSGGHLNDLWKFDVYEIYDIKDFSGFSSAWLSEKGDANFNPVWDIAVDANDVIDVLDLQVFCEGWLVE